MFVQDSFGRDGNRFTSSNAIIFGQDSLRSHKSPLTSSILNRIDVQGSFGSKGTPWSSSDLSKFVHSSLGSHGIPLILSNVRHLVQDSLGRS